MKGVIFDLDGVIVSTDNLHFMAWKEMADGEGIYFDKEINNRLRGVSRMESLNIILERATRNYSIEEKILLAEKKNDIYKELLKSLTPQDRLFGVTETLNNLRKRGFKLAIGSSSKNTPAILKHIGLEGFFDAVSDGNNILKSKPDPEVFIKAAEMLKLKPEECYIVEDAKAGIDAGITGGFITVGVGDAAEYYKTDFKLKDIMELIKLVNI